MFAQLDTGSRIALAPLPVVVQGIPRGTVATRLVGGELHGYAISGEKPLRADHELMMPHAAVCRSRLARTPAAPPEPVPEPDVPLF